MRAIGFARKLDSACVIEASTSDEPMKRNLGSASASLKAASARRTSPVSRLAVGASDSGWETDTQPLKRASKSMAQRAALRRKPVFTGVALMLPLDAGWYSSVGLTRQIITRIVKQTVSGDRKSV